MPESRSTRHPIAASLPDETLAEINRLWTIARVFANTAHDVNNALQAISGNAELLKAGELEPAVQRRVETIGAEAARASTLINALQAYVRGDRDLSPVVDLGALTAKAVSLRTAALKRERIVVDVESGSGRPMVPGPGSQLLQILLDLLLEAERTLRGKTTPKIVVRVETDATGSSVVVRALAVELPSADTPLDERAADLLTDAQLWAARYLAQQAGASVTAASAAGEWSWTLTVPAPAGLPV